MTTITWVTMIGVLGYIWGGLIFWVTKAMRKEAEKAAAAARAAALASSTGPEPALSLAGEEER